MKKLIALFAPLAVIVCFSCSNQPAEAKKEVIVTPPQVIIKEKPVIVVKDPPEKNTEITLDKNGVKVKTKKVNVVIDQ
jgi:hypothetical protein